MKKPKITITLVDQKGTQGCHRGHRIGDSFDFDTQRGELCPRLVCLHTRHSGKGGRFRRHGRHGLGGPVHGRLRIHIA